MEIRCEDERVDVKDEEDGDGEAGDQALDGMTGGSCLERPLNWWQL